MGTPAVYEFKLNGVSVIKLYYNYDGNTYGMPRVVKELMDDLWFQIQIYPKLLGLSGDMSITEREDMSLKFASWLTSVVRPHYSMSDKGFECVCRNYKPQYIFNLITKNPEENKS
jgi:hypothetical protein